MTEDTGGDSHPTSTAAEPDYVAANRAYWGEQAPAYARHAEGAWALQPGAETWGIFAVPESELRLLPDDLAGKDAIEVGCGTAYVSAWLARRGARVVGIDPTPEQLATARRLQQVHGLQFPLLQGIGERVPYPDASFDFAISEYGAALWADPYAWIPEAARLLRPGGRLVFLTNSLLAYLCVPDVEADGAADERLKRPQFGMHRISWPDDPHQTVEFHLAHGDWVRLLRRSGFEVEDLIEVRVPPDATTSYEFVDARWASQWPCEEVWKARRLARGS